MGRLQVRWVVLAAAAVLIVGCGGDDSPAEAPAASAPGALERSGPVPEGWKVTATKHFSYAHPADWKVDIRGSKAGTPGDVVAEVSGPETTPGLPPDVVVTATPDYASGLEGLLIANKSFSDLRFKGRKILEETRPEIPGAVGGRLIEADYPNTGPDGTVTTIRQYDLVALSKQDTSVGMFVRVPADQAESSRVREIVKTLEIR